MTSTRPYLIRAFFQWITDNNLTPYLLIDAEQGDVHVPKQHVKNGQIVFNITPGIVDELEINNQNVTFIARFSGVKKHIYVPINAVLAIYAKENGRGMAFNESEEIEGEPPSPAPQDTPPPKRKPSLKIVK